MNAVHKLPPPQWDIYLARAKATYLGTVEALTADAAIEVAVKEFDVKDPKRLIAVRRPSASLARNHS